MSRSKSIGVIFTSPAPKYIGTARKPVIPMSRKSGGQLTITSVSISTWAPANIASALATKLRWVIRTALGEPVDPEVSWSSARSSSPVSTGSIGLWSRRSAMVSTLTPSSESNGAAGMNGSEMTIASAQRCRSVRGVG
jgi:hypothetical protein